MVDPVPVSPRARQAQTPGGDRLGSAVAVIPDLNGDGVYDVLVGAVGKDSSADNAGAVFILAGHSGDTLRVLTGEQRGDAFGATLVALPDIDGDQVADFAVGAPGWDKDDSVGVDAGKVYVYSGKSGSVLSEIPGQLGHERFGFRLAMLKDVNGDGQADLAVGQERLHSEIDSTYGRSAVWLVSATTGDRLRLLKSDLPHDRFAYAIASAGDVDGDGVTDVVVGAYRDSQRGLSSGAAYVLSGRNGDVLYSKFGERILDHFGFAVAGGLDLTGDGQSDFVVGARFQSASGGRGGKIYVYSGQDGSLVKSYSAQQSDEHFGSTLQLADDADGDGRADILVGAVHSRDGDVQAGAVYLISSASGQVLLRVAGENDGDRFGHSISPASDLDGDGVADLLIGASGNDAGGRESGRAYVVSARSSGVVWSATGTSTIAVEPIRSETDQPLRNLESLEEEVQGYDFPLYDTSEVDAAPIIRRSVAAEYPEASLQSGLTGWVFVKILVLPDGEPAEIQIQDDSGLGPEFREAAIAAAEQWAFLAATRDGEDVACWAVFPIGFAPPLPDDQQQRLDSLSGMTPPVAGSGLRGNALAQDTLATDSLSEPESEAPESAYEADQVTDVPLLTARVDPEYPAAARIAGDTATVVLRLLVDSTGAVKEALVKDVTVRGKGFEAAAIAAARRWRYEPGQLEGRAVNVWLEASLAFHEVPDQE
jgi:TonB family protein